MYWMRMRVTDLAPEFVFFIQLYSYVYFSESISVYQVVASCALVFALQVFLLRSRLPHFGWGVLILLGCSVLFFVGNQGLILPGKAGGVIEPHFSLAAAWSLLSVGLAILWRNISVRK